MKKIAKVFLTLVLVVAIIGFVCCVAGIVLFAVLSDDIVAELSADPEFEEIANIFVAAMIFVFVVCALVCVTSFIVCLLTKKKLKVATNRNQMLPYAILNVIFGSTVAAIMLFVMGNRYYQSEKIVSDQ